MWFTSEYKPLDIAGIIDMTKEFYGDIEISNINYLKWQYESNPAGNAVIMLAKDSETNLLAGQYIVIPMLFQIENRLVKATLSLNTLTKKEYRGQGVFTGLADSVYLKCKDQGLEFTYGFPNPNSYPGFVNKLNFNDIGKVPLLIRPLDLKSFVRSKIGSLVASFVGPLNFFFKVNEREYNNIQIYEITKENVQEINALWEKVKRKYKIIGIRNAEYIKWRYYDIPQRQYKVYGVAKNGELFGYIVGRCTDVKGMRAGMIVDFLLASNSQKAGEMLVNKILNYFIDNDMELSGSLMMTNTEEYRILRKCGFYKCPKLLEPQPFPVIYRKHLDGQSDEIIKKFSNWFLTMGDYDVI